MSLITFNEYCSTEKSNLWVGIEAGTQESIVTDWISIPLVGFLSFDHTQDNPG